MTENEKVSLGLFHRYKWSYNLQREFKEAPLQYQTLASGVRVEEDNKKTTQTSGTHTYTSTYLVDSTTCLFFGKESNVLRFMGLFHNQIWLTTKKSLMETRTFLMRAFGQDVFQQTSWFSRKKNKTKRVFPRFLME